MPRRLPVLCRCAVIALSESETRGYVILSRFWDDAEYRRVTERPLTKARSGAYAQKPVNVVRRSHPNRDLLA